MNIVHVELRQANEFVAQHHRHHQPVTGHRFSIGAEKNGRVVGVAIIGRPVARAVDQHNVVEVSRLCTDGTHNACSFLYAAAANISKALGYMKIQTYILESESGTSLRAAGWTKEAVSDGGNWTSASKPVRRQDQPQGPKQRWAKLLMEPKP